VPARSRHPLISARLSLSCP